jgi:hypothetical protein
MGIRDEPTGSDDRCDKGRETPEDPGWSGIWEMLVNHGIRAENTVEDE